jgi:hypothetical protein
MSAMRKVFESVQIDRSEPEEHQSVENIPYDLKNDDAERRYMGIWCRCRICRSRFSILRNMGVRHGGAGWEGENGHEASACQSSRKRHIGPVQVKTETDSNQLPPMSGPEQSCSRNRITLHALAAGQLQAITNLDWIDAWEQKAPCCHQTPWNLVSMHLAAHELSHLAIE